MGYPNVCENPSIVWNCNEACINRPKASDMFYVLCVNADFFPVFNIVFIYVIRGRIILIWILE
jgi:hypothetical protein